MHATTALEPSIGIILPVIILHGCMVFVDTTILLYLKSASRVVIALYNCFHAVKQIAYHFRA